MGRCLNALLVEVGHCTVDDAQLNLIAWIPQLAIRFIVSILPHYSELLPEHWYENHLPF